MNNLKISTLGKHQRGLTLIELMIGLTLGLLMTGLIIQIFLSNRQIHRFGEAMSLLQEQGRFAMKVMSEDAQMAGFRAVIVGADPVQNLTTALPNRLQGANNSGVNNSDSFTVRYESTNPRDCTGAVVASPVINTYSVATVGGQSVLTCNGIQLMDGVEAMQVLYGEDTDADGAANRYVSVIPANVLNVVSMRISILISSTESVSPDTAARTYAVLDQQYGPFNDSRLRRVYTTTVQLRNTGLAS